MRLFDFVSLPLALVATLATACAAPTDSDASDVDSTEGAVVAGTATFEHPEIGMVWHGGLCTGTLIRPNVVLTASHCVVGLPKDEDATKAQPPYAFEIRTATESHRFAVDRLYSVPEQKDFDGSQRWRDKDISLLRLATDVPSSIARPLDAAPSWPWPGAHVAIYGYGCTDRHTDENGHRPGAGTKRTKSYRWTVGLAFGFSDTHDTCQGDSGGPLLDVDRGLVLGTTSGYVGPDDHFGDVPASYDIIEEIANRWSKGR
jgi:hypothetical protein